jgi:hypothetical protein
VLALVLVLVAAGVTVLAVTLIVRADARLSGRGTAARATPRPGRAARARRSLRARAVAGVGALGHAFGRGVTAGRHALREAWTPRWRAARARARAFIEQHPALQYHWPDDWSSRWGDFEEWAQALVERHTTLRRPADSARAHDEPSTETDRRDAHDRGPTSDRTQHIA